MGPIFIVFGMTRPGIEPQPPSLRADALTTRPLSWYHQAYLVSQTGSLDLLRWAHTIGLSVSENLLHIKLEDNLIRLSYQIIFISSNYTINKIRFITDYRSLDRFETHF